ncbi:hypothetical protein [Agromyces humatus]|uniref:Lipoprotein n=1 Tax=Agromyces humatus TaxID=279573 RepID=A0ABN2KVK9_9MICO|nr:hypothetical protein [Agromyces humatus]
MAAIVSTVAALTGCTDGSPDASGSQTQGCGTEVPFDAQNFVDPTLNTNPYYPTQPGLQWVRGGSTLVGGREVPYEVISTMTDVIRVIDGVPAIAMLDEGTDSGEINQVGIDYFALDRDGNVWILGAYTEDYEGGEYTNTEDAWLGAAKGQTLGILAPAEVTIDTPMWCIGEIPGEDAEVGMPAEIGTQQCVAFGCYDDVRVVQEGTAGAPDNENKSYAPGVGVIKNVPLDASIHKDRFELLNFVELSPAGLTEASNMVLALEAHARESAAPEVFGAAPISTRAE